MTSVWEVDHLPAESLITNDMSSCDYFDVFKVTIDSQASIREVAQAALSLPRWIQVAMLARDYLVAKPFGLKTGGDDMGPNTIGFAPVLFENENEIVMGHDDRHLYFRLSFLRRESGKRQEVYLNTVVAFHNVWGRRYFALIRMGHKLVVKSVLRRLNASLEESHG